MCCNQALTNITFSLENDNMKFLVSSKVMGSTLNGIDLETNCISRVLIDKDKVTFFIGTDNVAEIWIEPVVGDRKLFEQPVLIEQDNRRWDWVKQLMNRVPDQPIVMEISERIVNIIFQY